MNTLTWTPPPGRQTAALRAAGLSADDLKAAGFRWGRAQRWEAPETPEAVSLFARLTMPAGAGEVVQTPEKPAPAQPPPSALELACADAGITLETNGATDLERKAARLAAEAHQDIAGIPGGQPVGSTTDANRRERSAEKMRLASELFAKAEAKREAARQKARELAERLDADAEQGERPRDMGTPKRMAQGMHSRLQAAVARRAAGILRAWADQPERLPDWKPNRKEAESAASRRLSSVPNGWHSYHVETDEPSPSDDATVRAIRNAYPEAAMGASVETAAAKIERLEAAIRFSPIPGFFPTPPVVIQRVMELADIREGNAVLEPEAGNGFMAEAARAAGGIVECCEINGRLREILEARGFRVVAEDCLAYAVQVEGSPVAYDRIVMNPPFEKGQDALHIRRMFDLLRPGGRLVSVCSTGPFYRSATADVAFREWLEREGAEVEDVEPGAFSGSDAFRKTGVSVKLITIDRGDA